MTAKDGQATDGQAVAIFAGGCFWCMEPPFDRLDGVLATTSGYTGGTKVDPTYHEVSAGGTGHAEAVQVTYDPAKVTYEQLLDVYWHNVDPLDPGGQFCDRGDPVPHRDLRPRRGAAEARRSLEAGARGALRAARSSPRSCRRAPSTRPRTTTRTTTRRTRSGTSSTAGTAAATSAWPNSGARRRRTEDLTAASRACRRAAPRRGVVLRYESGL